MTAEEILNELRRQAEAAGFREFSPWGASDTEYRKKTKLKCGYEFYVSAVFMNPTYSTVYSDKKFIEARADVLVERPFWNDACTVGSAAVKLVEGAGGIGGDFFIKLVQEAMGKAAETLAEAGALAMEGSMTGGF